MAGHSGLEYLVLDLLYENLFQNFPKVGVVFVIAQGPNSDAGYVLAFGKVIFNFY